MGLRQMASAVGLAGVLVLSASCGGDDGESTDGSAPPETFTMHALLATSGNYAAIGEAMRQGAEAAVEVINANGGVFGSPMELEVIDTTSVANEAVAKAQRLISEGEVAALLAGTASSEISAVVPITGQHEIFVAHHGAGIGAEFLDPEEYPFVFGTAYQPTDQGMSLADELSAEGFSNVTVITTDNVAGESSYEAMEAAFEDAGITSEAIFIPDDAVDVTPQMQQAMDTNPDALVLDTFGAVAGPTLEARITLGVDVPTYGSQYLTSTNIAELASPQDLEGLRLQALSVGVQGSDVTDSESFKTFFEALTEVTGGELIFTMNTYAVGYNDVILAATAAKLAESTDAAAMAEAIESATPEDLHFLVGPTDYSAERHVPTFGPEFWSFVPYGPMKNGLIVPAES